MEALVTATRGRMIPATVTGPLGEPVALPPFPVDARPGIFGAYVASVAEALEEAGIGEGVVTVYVPHAVYVWYTVAPLAGELPSPKSQLIVLTVSVSGL